jgi:hypothetical protein
MPHKEPNGDGAKEYYRLYPYELQKALRGPLPNKILCPLCSKDGSETCERRIKKRDPRPGFCSSFEPPCGISFAKVNEAMSTTTVAAATKILAGK